MQGMEEVNARVAKALAPYFLELIRKDIQREREQTQTVQTQEQTTMIHTKGEAL